MRPWPRCRPTCCQPPTSTGSRSVLATAHQHTAFLAFGPFEKKHSHRDYCFPSKGGCENYVFGYVWTDTNGYQLLYSHRVFCTIILCSDYNTFITGGILSQDIVQVFSWDMGSVCCNVVEFWIQVWSVCLGTHCARCYNQSCWHLELRFVTLSHKSGFFCEPEILHLIKYSSHHKTVKKMLIKLSLDLSR